MKNTSIKKHKGFEYIKLKHNKAMITKYSGEEQELSIPARLSWHKVTSIANEAFMGCTALTSITIPDSITDIGEGAFRDCTALTSIKIPDSVTAIGEGAFRDCTALTSITIPKSV